MKRTGLLLLILVSVRGFSPGVFTAPEYYVDQNYPSASDDNPAGPRHATPAPRRPAMNSRYQSIIAAQPAGGSVTAADFLRNELRLKAYGDEPCGRN